MAGRVEDSVWEERRDWIRRQQESGLSVARFCQDNGLHVGNFYAWRNRLAKASGEASVVPGKLVGGRQGLTAFVQMSLPPVAVTGGMSWIEVSLADGMVVRVPASICRPIANKISLVQVGRSQTPLTQKRHRRSGRLSSQSMGRSAALLNRWPTAN